MVVELQFFKNKKSPVEYTEAIYLTENSGTRLPTNMEIDEILQDPKLRESYKKFFPCWTGTSLEYEGNELMVNENGKKTKINLPLDEKFYEMDQFGMPSGKPTSSGNPRGRYLTGAYPLLSRKTKAIITRNYYSHILSIDLQYPDLNRPEEDLSSVGRDSNPPIAPLTYKLAVVKENKK